MRHISEQLYIPPRERDFQETHLGTMLLLALACWAVAIGVFFYVAFA